MSEERETYTVSPSGQVETVEQAGVSMPADYTFASVNDYVHAADRHFEELQCLALGMAGEIERLRKQAAPEPPVVNGSFTSGPVAYAVLRGARLLSIFCVTPAGAERYRDAYGDNGLVALYAAPQPGPDMSVLFDIWRLCGYPLHEEGRVKLRRYLGRLLVTIKDCRRGGEE